MEAAPIAALRLMMMVRESGVNVMGFIGAGLVIMVSECDNGCSDILPNWSGPMEAEEGVMTTPRTSQPATLLLTAVISAVMGIGGSAGMQQLSVPALESRIDRLEATKERMEYQIEDIKDMMKSKCYGTKYQTLAKEEKK